MDICVVGNGPLSKENRAQIQKCELVVRFNDCKNMKKNERMDIHVMREIGNKHIYKVCYKTPPLNCNRTS